MQYRLSHRSVPADGYSTIASEELLSRARRVIAGGDSSTMRVLPYHLPLVATRGKGARVWDADGNEFIDLNMAFGPLIFGHCSATISNAVTRQIRDSGSQLGFPTEITVTVAEKIQKLFPSMELMRFANSGTEADVSAVRLARAFTGRPAVVQFEGHYHGWSDTLFNRYHAPLEDLPQGAYGRATPGTSGLNGAPHDNFLVRWNDLDSLEKCLADHRGEIAAVIMEPIMGNAGVIPPEPEFLENVRALTKDHGALLIFDEVITGLRVAPGGAQQLYGVMPDITVISKALGGGYPVAAFGASREIMELVVNGTMFHGGVYSGNAAVMSAANAVLDEILLHSESIYSRLNELGNALSQGISDILARARVPHLVQSVGPLISLFLTTSPVEAFREYRDVRRHCDFNRFIRLQHLMQQSGVYFHPNQFEPMFLSTAHTSQDVATVLDRFGRVIACL